MVAMKLGVTQSKASREFNGKYGFGVLQYMQELRIEKAMHLLTGTEMDIDEIYTTVGYTNRRTFDRIFRQYNGMTAVRYRKTSKKQ